MVREIRARDGSLVEYGETLLTLVAGAGLSLRRILIANRGEIAVRIARTCQQARHRDGARGIRGRSRLAAGATGDARGVHRACASRRRVTCRPELLVQAALGTGCDAIHPGYGFLSERAAFARLCEQHGLVFIGPTSDQLAAAGDKLAARAAGRGGGRAGGAGRRGAVARVGA